eukprot:10471382-Alexandrium_andersonii.AAC.1
MSASLVGSEMCIRDRRSDALRALQWIHGRGESEILVLGDWNCTIEDSVSYTHLTLPTICSV